jgi:hypothetical protein
MLRLPRSLVLLYVCGLLKMETCYGVGNMPDFPTGTVSITSGYPLGYHDAIWHPRARIQDIIKTYPHLNI